MIKHSVKETFKKSVWDIGGTLNEMGSPSEIPERDVIECINWKPHRDGLSREKRPGYTALPNPPETFPKKPIRDIQEYEDFNGFKTIVVVTHNSILQRKEVPGFNLLYTDVTSFADRGNWLFQWNNKILCLDRNGAGHRVLQSTDGTSWSELFSITQSNNYDGFAIAEMNGHIFISLYDPSNYAGVAEWDGTSVTYHYLGYFNYGTFGLFVWDGKLWAVTNATPSGNDKWKIYYYNGVNWNAIDDYDGAAFVPLNIDNKPAYELIHRAGRLVSWNGGLYFICSVYNVTDSDWTFQVWKFNASTYSKFTKVYDSHDDSQNYALSSVFEYRGILYVVGSKFDAAGQHTNQQRLYSSASDDLSSWAVKQSSLTLGFPMAEVEHDGRVYLYCVYDGNGYMKAWYFNHNTNNFYLEGTITTNPQEGDTKGGGLVSYNNELYLSKYKEIHKRVVSSNEWTEIYTQQEIINRPIESVQLDERLHVLMGDNKVIEGSGEGVNVYDLGIVAPQDAPEVAVGAAGNLTGDYKYLVTFYRSGNYPCESNPSPESISVSPSSQKVNLTNIPLSTDPKVNCRRIYRTYANLAVFYWLVDIEDNTTTAYEDNYTDSELGDEVSYNRYPPPVGKYYEVWDNRLWIAGVPEYPNLVYFTNTGTSEEMANTNFIQIKRRESDYVMQIKAFGDCLYVLKKKSMFRIETVGESYYQVNQLPQNIGTDASWSVAVCDKYMLWKSEFGIEVFNGESCWRPILSDLVKITLDSINRAQLEKAIGGHNEHEGEYWLSVPTGTNEEPNVVIVYNYIKSWFTIYEYAKNLTYLFNLEDYQKNLVFLCGTADGFVFTLNSGTTDAGTLINSNWKTKWFYMADERAFWNILRRMFIKYILPEGKTITMKVYTNFKKTAVATISLAGNTPTSDVTLRNEILRRVNLAARGYYVMFEFINNEDAGGECRIIGWDKFFKRRVWKKTLEAD